MLGLPIRKTRRIQQYVQSHADLNTVAPDEPEAKTSKRVETLELEALDLDNVDIKPRKKLALPRASTSALIDVSI